MNEQLLKTSGADVLSYRNKTQKKLQGSDIHASPPLPPTLYVRGLKDTKSRFVSFENNCLPTQLQKIKVTERKLKS